MNKKMRWLLLGISLFAASCSLETPERWGDRCPPDASLGTLEYIITNGTRYFPAYDAFASAFSGQICPADAAHCYLDDYSNYYCMAKCVDDKIAINGECVDPKNDDRYCAAVENDAQKKEVTSNGIDCAAQSKKCKDSECMCACQAANGLECPTTLEHCGKCNHPCPDQHPDDPHSIRNSCEDGVCHYRCENGYNNAGTGDQPVCIETAPHSIVEECGDGVCHYRCEENYDNCGTSVQPVCIEIASMSGDSRNCGGCNIQCAPEDKCLAGKCVDKNCTEDMCISPVASDNHYDCYADTERCGSQCINCNALNHVESSMCRQNQCWIVSCEDGYHKSAYDNICMDDDLTACGGNNCYSMYPHLAEGKCEDGRCILSGCESGYHVYEDEYGPKCEEDSLENCGGHGRVCSTSNVANALTVECHNAVCVATACRMESFLGITTTEHILCDGRCIEKDKFDPMSCSICTACKECQTCKLQKITFNSGGLFSNSSHYYVPLCVTDSEYHIYGDACEENSDHNCGSERIDCTAYAQTCQEGKCQ